jgi:hypothetical protein
MTFLYQLECMGSVDSGLTAMQWSPDQELIVLITGKSFKSSLFCFVLHHVPMVVTLTTM